MALSVAKQREILKEKAEALIEETSNTSVKEAAQAWINSMKNGEESKITSANLVEILSGD